MARVVGGSSSDPWEREVKKELRLQLPDLDRYFRYFIFVEREIRLRSRRASRFCSTSSSERSCGC